MPTKADYLRSMEIPKRGQNVGAWTIKNVKTSEEEIERFKRYKFKTYVEIWCEDDQVKSGLKELQKQVRKKATVLSPYGNAYICKASFRYRNTDNQKQTIIIEGDCQRSYDDW